MNKNEKAIQVYNKIAEEYAKRYDSIESEEDLMFLKTFLDFLKPGSHIADIGCGTGYSTGYFTKNGMIAEGIDLSSGMITIAKRNYPELPFSIQDIREYEPAEEVDAVWAGYCLFHLEQKDFENVLTKIRSYLKTGGILYRKGTFCDRITGRLWHLSRNLRKKSGRKRPSKTSGLLRSLFRQKHWQKTASGRT